MTFYIERALDEHGLSWTFVQDYETADKAVTALDAVRARCPECAYRLVEVLDA